MKLILVEGKSDCIFLETVLSRLNYTKKRDFKIHPVGSKYHLTKPTLLKNYMPVGKYEMVIVVCDLDTDDPSTLYERLMSSCNNAGIKNYRIVIVKRSIEWWEVPGSRAPLKALERMYGNVTKTHWARAAAENVDLEKLRKIPEFRDFLRFIEDC